MFFSTSRDESPRTYYKGPVFADLKEGYFIQVREFKGCHAICSYPSKSLRGAMLNDNQCKLSTKYLNKLTLCDELDRVKQIYFDGEDYRIKQKDKKKSPGGQVLQSPYPQGYGMDVMRYAFGPTLTIRATTESLEDQAVNKTKKKKGNKKDGTGS